MATSGCHPKQLPSVANQSPKHVLEDIYLLIGREYGGGHLEPGYSEVALKVYNTTPLTDKYVRVNKIERIGDALQSILKIKKIYGS